MIPHDFNRTAVKYNIKSKFFLVVKDIKSSIGIFLQISYTAYIIIL